MIFRSEYATSGEYLARKMRHPSFVSVEGGEHSMHEASHADEVARLIDGFTRTLAH